MGKKQNSIMSSMLIMWLLAFGLVVSPAAAAPPFSASLCDPHCSQGGTPPSHHGGGTTPSHGGGSTKSPPYGGGGGSTPTTPSHGGGGHSTPSDPSHGNCGTPPSTPSSPPSGGGYYPPTTPTPTTPSTPTTPYVPTPSTPSSPPYTPTPSTPYVPTPSTPNAPSPPFVPVDPNSPFPCNYWRNHPGLVWGLVGWWGTVGSAFGVTSLPGFATTSVSLQQLLSNTRTDGYGALYREGTAALLNSMATHKFPYTTMQVRDRFMSGLSSNKAAAAQARLFKMANEPKLNPHTLN